MDTIYYYSIIIILVTQYILEVLPYIVWLYTILSNNTVFLIQMG